MSLNQYSFIIYEVMSNSSEGNFTGNVHDNNYFIEKLAPYLKG